MRTVILVGSILIADALRTIKVEVSKDVMTLIAVILISVMIMDLADFIRGK